MFKALFAQYNYSYDAPLYTDTTTDGAAATGGMLVFTLLMLVIAVPTILGLWKMFAKAGRPGWAAIVPFYNLYNILLIVGRPITWMWFLVPIVLLSWIPFLSLLVAIPAIILSVIICIDLAKSFGKDTAWGVLLFFFSPVIVLILGFGSAKYVGPSVARQTITEPPYPTHKSTASSAAPKTTKSSSAASKNDDSDDS